ncbi:MAG TPA: PQQ-like beta-propeller repeat protein [Kofleriaceae bacterium]|nr:PQQ-like beta-propeller repeat protein [Kofleriaceae bacterium]
MQSFEQHLQRTWYKNQASHRNYGDWRNVASVPRGKPHIVAETSLGNRIWSIPSLLNADTLVVGCWDHALHGLDRRTLAPLWRFSTTAPVYSSPAVLPDGSFVVGCEDGILRRISSAGELVWTFVANASFHGTPTIDRQRGIVFASCYDHHVYALAVATGDLLWKVSYLRPFREPDPDDNIYSSPALCPDGAIVFGTDWEVVCVADGRQRWSFATDGLVEGTAALDYVTGIGVVGCASGMVYGFDFVEGAVRWQRKTAGPVVGCAAISSSGCVCLGSDDGHAYGIDPASGKILWRTALGCQVMWTSMSSMPGGDFVFVGAAGSNGDLFRLDPRDGTIVSQQQFSRGVHSPPLVTPDGQVVVGSHFGSLYVVEMA